MLRNIFFILVISTTLLVSGCWDSVGNICVKNSSGDQITIEIFYTDDTTNEYSIKDGESFILTNKIEMIIKVKLKDIFGNGITLEKNQLADLAKQRPRKKFVVDSELQVKISDRFD